MCKKSISHLFAITYFQGMFIFLAIGEKIGHAIPFKTLSSWMQTVYTYCRSHDVQQSWISIISIMDIATKGDNRQNEAHIISVFRFIRVSFLALIWDFAYVSHIYDGNI